jgi:hypothetical protein
VLTHLRPLTLVFVAACMCAVRVSAQEPSPPAPPARTLQVEVTISRSAGAKVLSSTPYTMLVIAGDRVSTRNQIKLPVQSATFIQTGDKPGPVPSWTYQDVGTSIDCNSRVEPGGSFRISLTVSDTSVYPSNDQVPQKTAASFGALPSVRSFSSSNSAVLRDGQSAEFTVATDRLTGEVVKVAVKLTVVK